MGKRYIGAIILAVNGRDVEIKKLDPKRDLKRVVVATMNREGRSKGVSKGVPEFTLTLTAPVQPNGEALDWDGIEDATLSIYNVDGTLIEQYGGCFTKSVGTTYDMGGESTHDVEMGALTYNPADGRKAL